MIINGVEVKNVFPVTSKVYGNGYEIRVTKRNLDGERKTMQETFYNTSNLREFALLTKIKEIKENLISKIATGEARKNIIKPKKFSELAQEHENSKSQKTPSYRIGIAKIVRELNTVFGDKYLRQIKRTELEEFIQEMNEREYIIGAKKSLFSKDVLCNYVAALSAIFERGVNDGQIDKNPIKSYELFNLVEGLPAKERQILTQSEDIRFLAQLGKLPIYESIPFYIMRFTGCRSCEMAGLNWSLVSPDFSTIKIKYNRIDQPKKTNQRIDRSSLKTEKSERSVPIAPLLRRKLIEYKRFWDECKEGNNKFDNSNAVYCDFNGKPKKTDGLNGHLEKILSNARCNRVTCHALRHYWITELGRKGMPTKDIMKLAGHTRIETT